MSTSWSLVAILVPRGLLPKGEEIIGCLDIRFREKCTHAILFRQLGLVRSRSCLLAFRNVRHGQRMQSRIKVMDEFTASPELPMLFKSQPSDAFLKQL
jgi:hypothetical protein